MVNQRIKITCILFIHTLSISLTVMAQLSPLQKEAVSYINTNQELYTSWRQYAEPSFNEIKSVSLIKEAFLTYLSDSNEKILSYCTNVGPVELTILGDSVSGKYLLTVTPDLKKGIIKGVLKNGLLHAVWTDPDGTGEIIFGFNPGMTKFIAIYNASNNHSNWYNEWKGIKKENIADLNAESKQTLYCDWK